MDRERALQLAKKLAAFNADTATQAEVELAAVRLQKIMNEHQFSQLDLKAEEAKGNMAEDRQGHQWKRPPYWLKFFISNIGQCFRVKVIWHMDTSSISFLGDDTDVGLAKYFAGSILNLPLYNWMAKDWNIARKNGVDTKGYIPNWYLGFMQAIIKRLKDEYDAWYKELSQENQVKSRGLISVKQTAIAEFVKQRYPSLSKMRASFAPKQHSEAHARGYAKGMEAKINKGLSGSGESKKIG